MKIGNKIIQLVFILLVIVGAASACTANSSGCLTCTNNNCAVCMEGYFLVNNQSCAKCYQACKTCQTYSGTCTSCVDGYYLMPSIFLCSSCLLGCKACTSYNSCTSCFDGYYLNGSRCLCSSNCKSCDNVKGCICQDGYYSSGGLCYSCSYNCRTCSTYFYCSSCISGYYFNQSQCLYCGSGCLTCLNGTGCSACSSGYYLSGSQCNFCPSGCMICGNGGNCSSCYNGYYLQYFASQGICSRCMANCSNCSNSYSCNVCPSTNVYKINNTCTICPNSCYYCSDNIGCVACLPLYYKDNGSCNKCAAHCLSCTNAAFCLKCFYGYYVSADSSACLQCNGASDSNCSLQKEQTSSTSIGMIAGIAIGGAVITLLIAGLIYKRCKNTEALYRSSPAPPDSTSVVIYPLQMATWKKAQEKGCSPNEFCPICQGEGAFLKTECNHAFHVPCLRQWTKRVPNCPLCRGPPINLIRIYCNRCLINYLETTLALRICEVQGLNTNHSEAEIEGNGVMNLQNFICEACRGNT